MKERDTPLKLIRLWPKIFPGCYEKLDHLAGTKTDGEDWWPDYCALPISAAFTLLLNRDDMDEKSSTPSTRHWRRRWPPKRRTCPIRTCCRWTCFSIFRIRSFTLKPPAS